MRTKKGAWVLHLPYAVPGAVRVSDIRQAAIAPDANVMAAIAYTAQASP